MDLELTFASEQDILDNTIASTVTYAAGHGPWTSAWWTRSAFPTLTSSSA